MLGISSNNLCAFINLSQPAKEFLVNLFALSECIDEQYHSEALVKFEIYKLPPKERNRFYRGRKELQRKKFILVLDKSRYLINPAFFIDMCGQPDHMEEEWDKFSKELEELSKNVKKD